MRLIVRCTRGRRDRGKGKAMNELYEILEDIIPEADYKTSTSLVKDGNLTSFELVRLVTQINDVFDLSIPSEEITPENFDSAEAMYRLIERLEGEE